MSCENSWNQKQVPLPPPGIPAPTVFNCKDRSISFLPCQLPRNEFNIAQDLHSQNHQVLQNACSTVQCSLSATRHLPSREYRMIPGSHPFANQLFVNGPNIAQNANLLQHQPSSNNTRAIIAYHPPTNRMPVIQSNVPTYLQRHQRSSEGAHLIQNFHPVTFQQPTNESNISRESCSLIPHLPSNGISMSQNLNRFNQQLSISKSQVSYLPTHALSQNEFGRNQVKYPPDHQQSERESIMRQGLHSIFRHHSKDGIGILQNQYTASKQSVGNQSSQLLPANFPEMGFNTNQELSLSDASLHQNSYPQYSVKVHICVVGPPGCGKAELIRTFARSDDIRISTDKPLGWVVQQGMGSFGTTLKIDIWYGEDIISAVDDLRSLCESSKSVILLVYSVARKSTRLTALEWIKFLKKDLGFSVPIILIGNATDVDSSSTSRGFSERTSNIVQFGDGVGEKDEYGFAAFYEYSTKRVKDVEAVFLTAVLTAFHRTIQK